MDGIEVVFACKFTITSNIRKFNLEWDENFLTRMFHYILRNSYQAVEDKINFLSVEGDYSGIVNIQVEKNHSMVVISFSDNGIGIHSKDEGRIFKPFYTSKGSDRGNGVGLFFCERMMKDLNGRIYIKETKRAVGTTINLEFPTLKH